MANNSQFVSEVENVHFTSDVHFGHKNIIRYCNRPFKDVDDMDEQLIQRWNSVVKPDDVVWQLGDFTFYRNYDKLCYILRRLNGRKKAVLGNHCETIIDRREDLLAEGLFEVIVERARIKVGSQSIVLDHFPGRSWDRSSHGAWQLFGHVHNDLPPYGKSVDVGVDSTWVTGVAPYRPFSFAEIKRFMDKQEITEKHHKE